jgi:drug/metabolite transporter (DMT)-like permease
MNLTTIYLLALSSNLLFSTSSLVFSHYSTRFSPLWMNQTKVLIAIIAFGVTTLFLNESFLLPLSTYGYLITSGILGLCLGDYFLFKAYTTLGPSRSLILFSFQPLILGFFGWMTLGQTISTNQALAIICMIICVLVYVYEKFQDSGHWDLKSFLWALFGITLDAIGIMLTRTAYDHSPTLNSPMVNFIRCIGALIGFLLLKPTFIFDWKDKFQSLTPKSKGLIFLTVFSGTYLSLTLYLTALKYAHLASLTSIAITGPLWVSFLECLWHKRWPNKFQFLGMGIFLIGFYLMSL